MAIIVNLEMFELSIYHRLLIKSKVLSLVEDTLSRVLTHFHMCFILFVAPAGCSSIENTYKEKHVIW